MDESNDPNDKGFAIVGEPGPELPYLPPGTTIVPNPIAPLTYSLRDHCNVIASRENNASDSTEINWTVNAPDNTSITVVNPYNTVCSGGGFLPFSYQHVLSLSPPHDYMEIVRAVAEMESVYGADLDHDDRYIHHYCPFCDGVILTSDYARGEPFPHDQDCIVVKARVMIQAMPHVKVKNERVE